MLQSQGQAQCEGDKPMTKYKVVIIYEYETAELECSTDELLDSIQEDPILYTQDHKPSVVITPI